MGLISRVKRTFTHERVAGDDTVEFLCESGDYGTVAEPVGSSKEMPQWYRNMDMSDDGDGPLSVRWCRPFADAMNTGWIIRCPVDIDVKVDNDMNVQVRWDDRSTNYLEYMSLEQVGGAETFDGRPILKFLLPWIVNTPDGYSCLAVPPLNRREERFSVFSGFIDTDKYFEPMNAIFLWEKAGYEGTIEKGTPLVQLIPIKRDTILHKGEVRTLTGPEKQHKDAQGQKLMNEGHYYHRKLWQQKKAGMTRAGGADEDEPSCPLHR